MQRIYSW